MEPDIPTEEQQQRSRIRLTAIKNHMDEIFDLIDEEEADGGRCRELSLLRTQQQQARHWLRDIGDNRAFGY